MTKAISELTRDKLDEEREKTKQLSKTMRERNRRELKSKDFFIDSIENAKKELEEALNFMKTIEIEPKLLFVDSEKYFKSTRSMVYTIMNHWKNPNESIKGHDFQIYLGYIANQFFQSWLNKNQIIGTFTIEVRNPNQFPSIFSIYHEETELMQFNLLKKWYGIRETPITKEEITLICEEDIKRIDKEIENQKQSLQKAIEKREEPLKYYKGARNYISWLFINKKKLHIAFDKLVKREENILKTMLEDKERILYYSPIRIEENSKRQEMIEAIEPFFKELNYVFNSNKNELY